MPRRNNTNNFIFDGVSGLLQQWANTRYRNGHMIMPGTIPAGTLLYHGTTDNTIPSTPEWLATDPEHAHLFCREFSPNTGCYMLTVAPVRPLNILYLDGSSAAKMYGSMDTQDVLIWGETIDSGDRVYNEPARIEWFCNWIKEKGYELDGIVRMEPDFEIMLCDFSSPALFTVSFSHLNPGWKFNPNFPEPREPLPPGQRSSPIPLYAYRVIEAGMWHNDFPGETRHKVDLTKMISFYDEGTFPSLVEGRRGQERWEHRVGNVTIEEREKLMAQLDEALTSRDAGSGVDWTSMHRVIIHRYSERLEVLQYLLSNATQSATQTLDEDMGHIHAFVRGAIAQYMLHSAKPNSRAVRQAWAAPIFEQCATAYTFSLNASPLAAKMTKTERLMQGAVDGVLYEVCRVLVGIWAEGEEIGLGESEPELRFDEPDGLQKVAKSWLREVESLMEWLDWSVWVKCKPACGEEETCFLPTWPFLPHRAEPPWPRWPPQTPNLNGSKPEEPTSRLLPFLGPRGNDASALGREKADKRPDMFQKPTPMCMRRMRPYRIPYDLEWGF